jgi:hypothetical protein
MNKGEGKMKKITVAYYWEDQMTKEQVVEYVDGFLICDGLALSIASIADGKVAVLERVKPSEMFPGCYESGDGDYMQLNITEDVYDYIMRNYTNMSELELLNVVANGVRMA